MATRARQDHEELLRELTEPETARLYLNNVLDEDPDGFLPALRNVARARQMGKVAQESGVQRESLYRVLSEGGNPTLETLTAVLKAVGLRISIATVEETNGGS